MAKQEINIGTSPNDASGDPLRTAFEKANGNFTELYEAVQESEAINEEFDNSYRCAINVAVTTGDQDIEFSSPFNDGNYLLEITDALGIVTSLNSQNAAGFNITCSGNGTVHYKATYVK